MRTENVPGFRSILSASVFARLSMLLMSAGGCLPPLRNSFASGKESSAGLRESQWAGWPTQLKVRVRERAAGLCEEEALVQITADRSQSAQLGRGLNTLADDRHSQVAAE